MVKPARRASSPIQHDRSSRGAFALIDVIIAGVILAVGLGAVITLSGRSIAAAQLGEQLSTAAMLADEQLNLVLARGPDDYAKAFPVEAVCDEPFSQYRYRLEFGGGRSVGEPYEVSVTITWGEPSGGQVTANTPGAPAVSGRSVKVSTLMAPRQIGADVELDPDRQPTETILRGVR